MSILFYPAVALEVLYEMDDIMKYYNINRILLLSIGLWPYQNSVFTKIHVISMYFLFAYPIIFQLMSFITSDFSIYLLLEVFSVLFICIVFVIKYSTIYLNIDKIKMFLEHIKYDWRELQNPEEFEIMKKHANIGRIYTKAFAFVMYVIAIFFVMTHYLPLVLDVMSPLSEPRSRKLLIVIEIFFDQQKYFHFIMLNIVMTAFFGMTTIIAAETMLMILVQHACGLLKIASYRIKHVLDDNSFKVYKVYKDGKKCIVCSRLANAVEVHRKAITFLEYIRLCFAVSYFIIASCGVASLSINLFRLTEALVMTDKMDVIIIAAFICGHFCYMFWCNYIGQEMMNYSVDVFHQTCNIEWYMFPVHSQKLLILILCKSAKPYLFIVGSLYVISLEGFATLISMSLSYFAVIYSAR